MANNIQEVQAAIAETEGRKAALRYLLKDAFAKTGRPVSEDTLISQSEALGAGGASVDGFHLDFPLTFHLKYHGRGFKRPRHIAIILAHSADGHLNRKKALCERNGIAARFVDVAGDDFDVAAAVEDTVDWFKAEIARPEE